MRRQTTLSHGDVERSEQLELLPQRAVVSGPVDLSYIPRLKDTARAIEYACSLADLDPKQLCPDVVPDKTAWSLITTGKREPRFGEAWRFNKRVGNSALSLYFAYVDGWDLGYMRLRVDDAQRRIRELEEQVAERDRAIQFIVDAAHRRGGA